MHEASKTETVREYKERKREPLMGGYFRTWYDKASTGVNEHGEVVPHNGVNSMMDVPAEVDLLLVFHDWTAEDSPFWGKLKNEYVPHLNKQGTKLVNIFDGVKEGGPRFKITYASGWIAFELKEEMEAIGWNVLNDTFIKSGVGAENGQVDYNTKKGKLQYLKVEATEEELKNREFLKQDSNWETASEFDNNETKDNYQETFTKPISSKYWRYVIEEVNPDAFFKVISIPEIEIFGNDNTVKVSVEGKTLSGKVAEPMAKSTFFDIDLKGVEFVGV